MGGSHADQATLLNRLLFLPPNHPLLTPIPRISLLADFCCWCLPLSVAGLYFITTTQGTLASDGTKFDSSRDKGRTFSFQIGIGQVIAGWDQGVMKMSLGERAKLKIPYTMGYGDAGAGGVIPGRADLDFDVELLAIAGTKCEGYAKKAKSGGGGCSVQ